MANSDPFPSHKEDCACLVCVTERLGPGKCHLKVKNIKKCEKPDLLDPKISLDVKVS